MKSAKLQMLRSAQKKIELAENSAYVEVTPEELQAVSEANRPKDATPEAVEPTPAQHFEYELPTPPPGTPLTETESRYAHHQDLTAILADNPEEVPPRIRARAERLLELREEMNRPDPWSWMS